MKTKIGIIGSGNVGSALNRGLSRAGYESRVSTKENVAEVAGGAEVIFLAVPFTAVDDVIKKLETTVNGKIVVDVTNTLNAQMGFAGPSTSGAEDLQKKIPNAKVIKAFNMVFAQHMDSGKLNGQPLTAFVAGDDEPAKNQI